MITLDALNKIIDNSDNHNQKRGFIGLPNNIRSKS